LVNAEKQILKATIRGFNRAIILWLVSNKPMSGYAVVKEMERLTGQKFHQGTVYPLLYELEKKGLIASKWTHRGDVRIKNYMVSENGLKLLSHLREVFQLPIKEAMEDLIGEKTQPPNARQN
jgi:PadR family transcriptional regulator, regulatory protein PadR